MPRIIDMSHTLSPRTPVYPGDPPLVLHTVHTIQSAGYNVTRLDMGSHTGTHIDVPLHKIEGREGIDAIPLEDTMGPAAVLDLTALSPGEDIRPEHLEACREALEACNILLLKTGWHTHIDSQDFYTGYNGVSEAAAAWLVERGVKLLGLESPSVHAEKHERVHEVLLGGGVLVVEALRNLQAIRKERVFFCAAPLKLEGLDGSPVRAFAIEED